jgi:hypothetical protein
MSPRAFLTLVLGIFLSLPSLTTSAQNLVQNPSFESGDFDNRGDGFEILPSGSVAITGWTVINDSIAWGTIPNSAAGTNQINPFDGAFFLDLQGDGIFNAPYGGVSQTLLTVPDQVYHLSFYLGTQEDSGSPFTNGPISVLVSLGDISQQFNFDPQGTGTQWGEFGLDFTATDSDTLLSITGLSTEGGAYIGLDLVSVTPVPEPSSWALFIAGALALIFLRNRRFTRAIDR